MALKIIGPLGDPVTGTTVVSALDGATISTATVATGDKVLIQDVNDSDNLKTITAQSIADLAGGAALSWTPTGTWTTNTTYTSNVYIVNGNRLQGYVRVAVSGAPTSVGLDITMPSGWEIDPDWYSGADTISTGGTVYDSTAGFATSVIAIARNTDTVFRVYTLSTAGGAGNAVQIWDGVNQAVPMTFAASDYVNIYLDFFVVAA